MAEYYVIGPITGIEGLNRAEFERARSFLVSRYHAMRVDIPHDFIPSTATHEQSMRLSLWHIVAAAPGDMRVYALKGSSESPGASLEIAVCEACGIPVEYQTE